MKNVPSLYDLLLIYPYNLLLFFTKNQAMRKPNRVQGPPCINPSKFAFESLSTHSHRHGTLCQMSNQPEYLSV